MWISVNSTSQPLPRGAGRAASSRSRQPLPRSLSGTFTEVSGTAWLGVFDFWFAVRGLLRQPSAAYKKPCRNPACTWYQ
eukprot:6207283-Pleurochrysis_carterae.AAC.1